MNMPGYFPRDFVTGAAIGRGRTRPADIRKLRRSLDELDYLRSPATAKPAYTSVVADAVESFQRDFGLNPDGAIDPDGPTEQTLNLALAARRAGGNAGLAATRNETLRLNRKDLRLTRDSVNPGALGVWRDRTGRRVSEAKLTDPPRSLTSSERTPLLRPSTSPNEIGGREAQLAPAGESVPVSLVGSARKNLNISSSTSVEFERPDKFPSLSDIDGIERFFRFFFVKEHRRKGRDDAANVMEHYLGASGRQLNFGGQEALNFQTIRNLRNELQQKVINSEFLGSDRPSGNHLKLKNLVAGKSLRLSGRTQSIKTDRIDFLSEMLFGDKNFAFAFGKTLLKATPTYTAKRIGNQIKITGTISFEWEDEFDFHKGTPGAEEAFALERAGRAKPFKIRGKWSQNFSASLDIDKAGNPYNFSTKWDEKTFAP